MKKIIFFFFLSFLGIVVGYLLNNSYEYGLCYANFGTSTFDVSCHQLYEKIGEPLFYGMSALSVVFFVLIFVPHAFNAWKKFAVWYVPVAALIFVVWPTSSGGGLGVAPSFIGPSATQVYQFVSALYIAVSLGIIAYAWRSKSRA